MFPTQCYTGLGNRPGNRTDGFITAQSTYSRYDGAVSTRYRFGMVGGGAAPGPGSSREATLSSSRPGGGR